MGGRGSSSGLGSAHGAGQPRQTAKVADAKTMMDNAAEKMREYAKYAMPGKDYDTGKSEQYYRYKNEFNTARGQYNKQMDAEAEKVREARLKEPKEHKVFVNGYGEATTRYITSQSYERAQKRLDKEIQNRMKGKR